MGLYLEVGDDYDDDDDDDGGGGGVVWETSLARIQPRNNFSYSMR
jgi:hypothetical protein